MTENLSIFAFIAIGFFAQLIDGSMGMGYKTSTTSLLMALGLPPVLASSSTHSAGVFVSAASAFAHFKLGNVDRKLLWQLAIPGVIGGIIGAIILTLAPTSWIKPLVSIYLIGMGLRIVLKSLRKRKETEASGHQRIGTLAGFGGLLDAIGGGGWGPIVTGNLIIAGHEPRIAIGSSNTAEFIVSIAQTLVFFTLLDSLQWTTVLGLIIGGVIAAPLAAYITQKIPIRRFAILVGLLVIALSARSLMVALF
jgi:uncharacterized membrane protein YfcA